MTVEEVRRMTVTLPAALVTYLDEYRETYGLVSRSEAVAPHITVDEQLLQEAARLAGTHDLRAFDAVHLAAAQAVSPLGVQFMTFDFRLRTVAEQVMPGQVWHP